MDSQLRFVKRNLNSVNRLLNANSNIPLDKKEHKYLLVINTLYDQQKKMYDSLSHSIEDRIFSIHQPHLCPIVQGKSQAKVEFEQSKTAHGLNRIKARLRNTNESWIACIFLVLNLVKLAGAALPFLLTKIFRRFSAKVMVGSILRFAEEIYIPMILPVVRLNLGKDIIKNLC